MVECPRRVEDHRARSLDLEQHLRAGVRDGLVGADRAAELLALLRVGDGHLQRALCDADRFGAQRHGDDVGGAGAVARQRVEGAVGRDAPQPPRRVERLDGRRGRALGQRPAVAVAHHDHVGAVGVGHRGPAVAVAQRGHRAARLARGQARQPARALLVAAGVGDERRGGDGGQEGRGRQRGAELLLDHGQLDDAQAQPAVLLGHEQRRPAELADGRPALVGEAAVGLVGQPPDLLGLVARGEEVARGALDRALVVGEVEVHQRIRGSPSTRSATMFLRISVVPPSIELARARRKRKVQVSS